MSDTNTRNSCSQKPCQIRPERPGPNSQEDPNTELRGRPVLYTGVVWIGILRRFLIPRPCGSSEPYGVQPSEREPRPADTHPRSVSHMSLPSTSNTPGHKLIHSQPATLVSNNPGADEENDKDVQRKQEERHHSPLAVLLVRIRNVTEQVQTLSEDFRALIQDGRHTTSESISNIRREEAMMVRFGVVSASGLVGLLAGLKRGTITRLVYCATGATASAAICYPERARHYNSMGLSMARGGIIFAIALLKDGPQISLGGGEQQASKWTKSDKNQDSPLKTNNETLPSKTQFQSSENTTTHIRTNFGTLGHHHEYNKPSSNLKPSGQELNSPDIRKKTTTEAPSSYNQSQVQSSTHVGDSSSQCQSNSPHISSDSNLDCENVPSEPVEYPLVQNPQDEGISVNKQNSRNLHSFSLHGAPCATDDVNRSRSSKSTDNSNGNNLIVPIPELILEDDEDISENEGFNTKEKHPLNKKLSQYYVEKQQESDDFSDSSYDDLYTRRG